MAIIEVLFPKLIPDAATVKEAVAHVIPVLTKVLKEADYSRGARGWVVQEDDQDVSADFREIIIIGKRNLELHFSSESHILRVDRMAHLGTLPEVRPVARIR